MENSNKKFIVYKHTSPSNKCYIGITCQTLQKRSGLRGQNYLYDKYKIKHPHFHNAILKYGWDNFKHEVLYENLDEFQAKLLEMSLIRFYRKQNACYNATIGGDGVKTGKQVWNKGKKMPEWIVEKFRNKEFSDDTRRKMSLAKKGKPNTRFYKSVCVYDYNGSFIGTFNSITNACKELGIKNIDITKVLQHQRNHSQLYQFRYEWDKDNDIKKLDHINGEETYPIDCYNIDTKEKLHFDSWFDFPRYLNINVKCISTELYIRDNKMYFRNWLLSDFRTNKKIPIRKKKSQYKNIGYKFKNQRIHYIQFDSIDG